MVKLTELAKFQSDEFRNPVIPPRACTIIQSMTESLTRSAYTREAFPPSVIAVQMMDATVVLHEGEM